MYILCWFTPLLLFNSWVVLLSKIVNKSIKHIFINSIKTKLAVSHVHICSTKQLHMTALKILSQCGGRISDFLAHMYKYFKVNILYFWFQIYNLHKISHKERYLIKRISVLAPSILCKISHKIRYFEKNICNLKYLTILVTKWWQDLECCHNQTYYCSNHFHRKRIIWRHFIHWVLHINTKSIDSRFIYLIISKLTNKINMFVMLQTNNFRKTEHQKYITQFSNFLSLNFFESHLAGGQFSIKDNLNVTKLTTSNIKQERSNMIPSRCISHVLWTRALRNRLGITLILCWWLVVAVELVEIGE